MRVTARSPNTCCSTADTWGAGPGGVDPHLLTLVEVPVSIWATSLVFDSSDHADGCPRLVPVDPDRPCTCRVGPIRYQGSHVLPSDGDERGGYLDFAEVPGFISRADRRLCGPDDQCRDPDCCRRVWPFLRVALGRDVGVLDRGQVEGLHAYLGRWLQRASGDADV